MRSETIRFGNKRKLYLYNRWTEGDIHHMDCSFNENRTEIVARVFVVTCDDALFVQQSTGVCFLLRGKSTWDMYLLSRENGGDDDDDDMKRCEITRERFIYCERTNNFMEEFVHVLWMGYSLYTHLYPPRPRHNSQFTVNIARRARESNTSPTSERERGRERDIKVCLSVCVWCRIPSILSPFGYNVTMHTVHRVMMSLSLL